MQMGLWGLASLQLLTMPLVMMRMVMMMRRRAPSPMPELLARIEMHENTWVFDHRTSQAAIQISKPRCMDPKP